MKLTCVVDNAVRPSSPFWGEHGLSYLIETHEGRVLFDTGQSGTVLLHNLQCLHIDPKTIDALAISHAHYDHTGGLRALLEHVRPDIPLYANADLFRERFQEREGPPKSNGLPLSREALAARLSLKLSAAPQEILPGIWTSGAITERAAPMGGSPQLLMRQGDTLVPDQYLDDMALWLQPDQRAVLLCGCCHAGLLNTLAHVEHTTSAPIVAIAGGLHLMDAPADVVQACASRLLAMPALEVIYPGHCTGQAALLLLNQTLGPSRVRLGQTGTVIEIDTLPDLVQTRGQHDLGKAHGG
jgi:7,8-dihydropterin-6-yl-methyl-4-(beta-D-ribofuranosyl)aminobenzene 5'-phosphate synthase